MTTATAAAADSHMSFKTARVVSLTPGICQKENVLESFMDGILI